MGHYTETTNKGDRDAAQAAGAGRGTNVREILKSSVNKKIHGRRRSAGNRLEKTNVAPFVCVTRWNFVTAVLSCSPRRDVK